MFISIYVWLFNGTKIKNVSIQNKYLFQIKTLLHLPNEKPTHFASTLPKPHKPTHRPKLCQRACKADPRRNSFFSSHPSVFYFFANAQPTTDKYSDSFEHIQKIVQLDTDDRTPAANI